MFDCSSSIEIITVKSAKDTKAANAIFENSQALNLFTPNNGYVRVRVKMKVKKEKFDEAKTDRKKKNISAGEAISEDDASELNAPRWSVVSFESRVAGGLRYAEATSKMEELAAQKIAGLCIVTDEAAERVGGDSRR